ncbi:MAG: phosphatidate cytidylyltransferase [Dysgonamonadaceae bacterium]|jgi:phosphatidate cytidylyltransferase|nr:phosphatidate cytidylyltransferase [Dysgonamonadaceae bacterium]
MSNFAKRTLTGIVYVTLIVLSILLSRYSFLFLFSIAIVLCLREFYGLVNAQKRARVNPWYNCLGGLLLFISAFLYASGIFPLYIFFPYLLYIVIIFITELYEKQQDPITHMAYIFLGQCYIALPIALLNLIAFPETLSGEIVYYPIMILSLFVFIWVNDTGAYIIGILFGKHRLFERISPKKSWEGFFGGLFFTVASSFVFAYFEPNIPYFHWIGLSAIVVVFGTWGDLVESLMKRTLEIKDSGNTMPGHGGFLDRFDSLLLAVYAVLFYVQLFIRN